MRISKLIQKYSVSCATTSLHKFNLTLTLESTRYEPTQTFLTHLRYCFTRSIYYAFTKLLIQNYNLCLLRTVRSGQFRELQLLEIFVFSNHLTLKKAEKNCTLNPQQK